MTERFYITTTIPYVNADPHVGFALEVIQADALARAWRLQGKDVCFSTGTDEHGLKIYQKAVEQGKDAQAYVDEYAAKVEALKETLDLSFTRFIRTTDAKHVFAAIEFWKRCETAGDIYKKEYEAKYCVGCELEKTDSELVDGHCPLHPLQEIEIIKEENYFFRFSKYQKQLEEYVKKEGTIVPALRKEQALALLGEGIEDFSISRLVSKMPWGIPVPGDPAQVMYVWFDALVNYISTLDWPEEGPGSTFDDFWKNGMTVQCAGKDQIRMQSLMWQAMLLSANLPETKQIFYHGFITSGGQKMSKSLGNVIDPLALVEEFGTDAVRYFLLRHMSPFEDSDITRERILEAYNSGLANGLGNLVSRVMKMAEEYLDAPVKVPEREDFKDYFAALEAYRFNDACDMVWHEIRKCDLHIQETEPFKLVKEDPKKGKAIIAELAVKLYRIGRLLNPLMPETSRLIKEAVTANKKPENLFSRKP